jgi:NadR type nicotinamide-nucleotide adenylyltransferase
MGISKLSPKPLKKIVVIGPESTGKSTLCSQLAQHYQTIWCPEYAREYLLANGKKYVYENLLTIAQGQIALEEKYEHEIRNTKSETNHSPLLFIDTDMYVMKVWCEYVFGKCHQFILDEIANRTYDLYLLCNTDLPWTQDELREYPDEKTRQELYKIYKDILMNQSTPWIEIGGTNEQRLQNAISAVDNFCASKSPFR